MARKWTTRCLLLTLVSGLISAGAEAQPAPGGPPAVGVVRAEHQQMTQVDEFIGRIQAVGRVALIARVSAFLEKQLFVEGSEVKQGDLLYRLSSPHFRRRFRLTRQRWSSCKRSIAMPR